MNSNMPNTVYIFNCPVHGNEEAIFCFRAFDKENRKLWIKFQAIWEQDEWNEGELENYLIGIEQSFQFPK